MWRWLWCIRHYRALKRTADNTREFGFEGFSGYGKVISVYDGDTLRIAIKLPMMTCFTIINCRMDGYDAPEMRPSKSLENREEHILRAKEARDELAKYIGEVVRVDIKGFDKYGRFLVVLRRRNDESINDNMIRLNLGYEYHGGKKTT